MKKATDLWMDKTYNESEFYSHILSAMRTDLAANMEHKEQMERLLYKIDELRELQRLFHGGHKSKLFECKKKEEEMDRKIMALKTQRGYNIDRFKIAKPTQNQLF